MKEGDTMGKTAVLIPCFNESLTIAKVISDWKQACPDADIYVYDNNSTDNTSDIAKKNGAIVRFEPQRGKGNVVRTMFRDIDADCYIMVDGDDTYPAECGQKLIQMIMNNEADMVIGDRLSTTYFKENKSLLHDFGNRSVRYLINLLYHSDIKDIMSGCRAFNKTFVKQFPAESKAFETETEMAVFALTNNMRLKNIPINYKDRPKGSKSKVNTIVDGFKIYKMLFVMTHKYHKEKMIMNFYRGGLKYHNRKRNV